MTARACHDERKVDWGYRRLKKDADGFVGLTSAVRGG